ncbi:WecB/TagA/CpsF family glycosyltransferase [Rhabdaerophilum sp. SD176]|uniref:WecB/TagA/CpsF family glycosyltransferase n=1 Tax=Rhabdaerophilum sp. SD176 TaxID=2983548 RepID=UPI0024DFA452|nr:WecB/TagA/CpsF family glycosyltransferase [Rhabdaerophilum sp. SD176]
MTAPVNAPFEALERESIRIGPVSVAALARNEAIAGLHRIITIGSHAKIAFANAHLVNVAYDNPALANALGEFLVLPDGIGVDIGARLVGGRSFPANLNGTDLLPLLLKAAPTSLSVALFGGKPGIAERAAASLSELTPQHRYVVLSDGYGGERRTAEVRQELEANRADIVLVALGNPLQELWIHQNLGPRHCGLAFGVGALFDFLAGEVVRAPAFVRSLRLEWAFRLMQEPARLWRRYIVGNPLFLWRMVAQSMQARSGRSG